MIIRKTIAGKAGLVAAVALAALLTACATATPYQPNIAGQKAAGGFSETPWRATAIRSISPATA
jgi:hypothetical protein